MERQDIKLAIDMLEGLRMDEPCEDNIALDHCINVFEDCGNEIARLTWQRDRAVAVLSSTIGVCQAYATISITARIAADDGEKVLAAIQSSEVKK